MAARIDYFASLNSPWTHLGGARLTEIAAKHGANVRVYPIEIMEIFPASGGLPLPRRSPQRQAYRFQELERWRQHLGVPIQLHPKFFPANEAAAAHCIIAVRDTIGDAPAVVLTHRVLKAPWEQDADTGDRATLARLVAEVGLDADGGMTHPDDPALAMQRATETQDAIDRGVFGAPSYMVGEDLFWGQDRLDFLDRRLAVG